MSTPVRPAPIVTDDSAAFWEAAVDRRLIAQRCAECGRYRHPPRPMCPECRSIATDVVELSGRGEVYSYVVLHHPPNPLFEFPVVIVLVDLEEGIRLLSNLTGVAIDDLRIGMPVEVHFVPTAHDMAVPQFRPVGTS